MTDEQLSPRQLADELGVTPRTVQRWIADGRIPVTRVGGRVRLSRSSLGAIVTSTQLPRPGIGSLLIANRGEIAARVARTARRMGIRVVGIHEPGDRPADGLEAAHAVPSYLDGEAVIAAARRAAVDAIHPGYGFLAENPAFARAVGAAGLTWVGPPADAMAAMGDKAAARRRSAALGVPTIPGYDGDAQDDATLAAEAARIGYPLLVKPSAGGGGKGMRVVRQTADLVAALAGARREAHRSFGDDRLVLERFLEGARHIEIQVLFDGHGSGIHLGERDCSAQRRNQKVVEEAPGPSVTPQLRQRMGDAALTVAGAVGYAGAGTVEMLVTDAGDFFFLEMNTRLQVEHPVTEAVTGRDLVEDQIRVASGATLPEIGLSAPPAVRGHAVEARLYAEDPDAGFLPASGRLVRLRWPDGVRIDSAVAAGDTVTDRYDPMLAKLIAQGATRAEALDRLGDALDGTVVLGVRTNLRFLRWLLRHPSVRSGDVRTDTIANLAVPPPPAPSDAHWAAAAALLGRDDGAPWSGGWRLNAPAALRVRTGGDERTVQMPESRHLATPGTPAAVADGEMVHVDVDGQSLEFSLAPPPTVDEALRHAAGSAQGMSILTAPMPGRVVAVRATPGAAVRAHEVVVIIEAMKMEHAVVAPVDGTLTALSVAEGQQVARGDVLAEVSAYHAADG